MAATELESVANQRYLQSARLARIVAEAGLALWRRVDPASIKDSYAELLPELLAVVTAGQLLAANGSTDYVLAAMAAQNPDGPVPDLVVDPALLAGVASDGRALETAMLTPQVATFQALVAGVEAPLALAAGAASLVRLISTQVADAGRVGDGLAAVADRRVSGYYRRLTPPSCGRCAILAGKFFRTSTGFDRHPRCDCKHVPAHQADGSLRFDPRRYFESLPEVQADRLFGKAAAQAIRDGADPAQVVNARRGMATASIGGRQVLTTTEGVTRRGWHAYVQRAIDRNRGETTSFVKTAASRYRRTAKPRLMPEQIYSLGRELGWDRDEVVRQLKRNGYFLDGDGGGRTALARIAADVLRLPTAA